ncbi:MAG: metallophosphoesterase [Candidatus Cellulosilyticum pullistercoris]|uniref:Phosphoesterase n=1 Tax=Candidatus Cellulosilyticum pullistercoris TaxID=2838521 RepID=A0A9E2KAQ6_9FIRM|nr:metallophosphoesterase [Candidatus Cellulosilyticum pullistercoris]
MKVLVISDTHGNIENAKSVLNQVIPEGVKTVLHCGDYISDARLIEKFYPQVEVYGVYGNCDVGFGGAYSEVITLEGVSIYMSHGHKYGVKWGDYDEVAIDAIAHEATVAICGHSHEAYLKKNQGILIMNPGSLTLPRDSRYPSYGILELEDGQVKEASLLQILKGGDIRRHPALDFFKE